MQIRSNFVDSYDYIGKINDTSEDRLIYFRNVQIETPHDAIKYYDTILIPITSYLENNSNFNPCYLNKNSIYLAGYELQTKLVHKQTNQILPRWWDRPKDTVLDDYEERIVKYLPDGSEVGGYIHGVEDFCIHIGIPLFTLLNVSRLFDFPKFHYDVSKLEKDNQKINLKQYWKDHRNDTFVTISSNVPILRTLKFNKSYDDAWAYSLIETFLGKIYANPDNSPNVKMTNEEKIVSHGFDLVKSFRGKNK